MTNEPLDYFNDESGEQSLIGRIADVPKDTEKSLPVRFVAVFSLVASGITLLVIGVVGGTAILTALALLPHGAYYYLEFGLFPWELGDVAILEIPLIWQFIQLAWMVALLSMMISVVALVESGDSE